MSESHEAMSNPKHGNSQRTPRRQADTIPDEEHDWTRPTAAAGIVGALIVAVFFLVLDVISGRGALWTPAILGAALFLGEGSPMALGEGSPMAIQSFDPLDHLALVTGYSVVHAVVFVGFASLVASQWLTHERARRFDDRAAAIAALFIFVGLQITFTVLGWLLRNDFDLAARLGSGWIATANALASVGMTAVLWHSARRLAAAHESGSRGRA